MAVIRIAILTLFAWCAASAEITYGYSPLFALGDNPAKTDGKALQNRGPAIKISPNPFNPQVRIETSLPGMVRLDIYDVSGKCIQTLESGQEQGKTVFTWNSRNRNGGLAASGIYFARLTAQGRTHIARMMLLK